MKKIIAILALLSVGSVKAASEHVDEADQTPTSRTGITAVHVTFLEQANNPVSPATRDVPFARTQYDSPFVCTDEELNDSPQYRAAKDAEEMPVLPNMKSDEQRAEVVRTLFESAQKQAASEQRGETISSNVERDGDATSETSNTSEHSDQGSSGLAFAVRTGWNNTRNTVHRALQGCMGFKPGDKESEVGSEESDASVSYSLNIDQPTQESGVSTSTASTPRGLTNLNQISQRLHEKVKTETLASVRENSDTQYTEQDYYVQEPVLPVGKKMTEAWQAAKGYVLKRLSKETAQEQKSTLKSEQVDGDIQDSAELKEITNSPIIDQQPVVVVPPSNSFCYEHRYALAGVGTAVIVTGVMYKLYTDGYFQLLQQYLKKNKRIK
jgi:hypothetical protein